MTEETSADDGPAIIIGISGPSSSGKTTVARLLQRVFSGLDESLHTFIIHEDDFYYPDDRIPWTTTRSGEAVQDWDTIDAIDVSFLSSALSYVREHAHLPPRLQSKEDLNEARESGVDESTINSLRETVVRRLGLSRNSTSSTTPTTTQAQPQPQPQKQPEEKRKKTKKKTLAFLDGFLIFSPPPSECSTPHILRPVHDTINLHLFIPAPYDLVKSRREARTGYVTIGPGPAPPQTTPATGSGGSAGPAAEADHLGGKDDSLPPQNFWVDPPGYVDDVVWPRYVQDHAWLLLPEEQEQQHDTQGETVEEMVKSRGQGVNVRTDAGVKVAPGQGRLPIAEILKWALEEIVMYLENKSAGKEQTSQP